jgi:hypothetical protein
MLTEQIIETAIKQAVQDELAEGVVLHIRAFWLDDEPEETTEEIALPCLEIVCQPAAFTAGTGASHREAEVALKLRTHTGAWADAKRTALRSLYSTIRDAIDADDWTSLVPSGISMNIVYQGGGFAGVEADISHNVCEWTILAKVCGVETTTTTTTTTTTEA